MKYEDMANWTEDQLKNEIVRLSEECEKKRNTIQWHEQRQQDDCIRINQLATTIDTLVDRYANLRKNKGMC